MSDLPIVFETPDSLPAAAPGCLRNKVRAELRTLLNSKLEELTGLPDVHMLWTVEKYAKLVVLRYGYRLAGWPEDIPFCNLSDIPGGVQPLLKLRLAWISGVLRFEPATPADRLDAVNAPERLCPRPGRSLTNSPVQAVVTEPAVFHSVTLSFLGIHPTSTNPTLAELGPRPRRQRSDVKKARRRPVTNPLSRPLRRAKPGVKSARYVLEGSSDGGVDSYWLVDDPIEEFQA